MGEGDRSEENTDYVSAELSRVASFCVKAQHHLANLPDCRRTLCELEERSDALLEKINRDIEAFAPLYEPAQYPAAGEEHHLQCDDDEVELVDDDALTGSARGRMQMQSDTLHHCESDDSGRHFSPSSSSPPKGDRTKSGSVTCLLTSDDGKGCAPSRRGRSRGRGKSGRPKAGSTAPSYGLRDAFEVRQFQDIDKVRVMEAVCRLCPANCARKYILKKGESTSTNWAGAIRHLEREHRIKTKEGLDKAFEDKERQKLLPLEDDADGQHGVGSYFEPHKARSAMWQHCVEAVGKLVAWENLPFHLGERPAFNHFMRGFHPKWPRVSAKAVTNAVKRLSLDVWEGLKREMSDVRLYTEVAFTADCWSSVANDAFATTSLHWIDRRWRMHWRILGTQSFPQRHTAKAISRLLYRQRLKLGIIPQSYDDKDREVPPAPSPNASGFEIDAFFQGENCLQIPCITTDNAANMAAGAERNRSMDWCRCICHCLHLAVMAGLQVTDISRALDHLRAAATKFHRSSAAWRKFKEVQKWCFVVPGQQRQQDSDSDSESLIDECGGGVIEEDVSDEGGNSLPYRRRILPERPLRLLAPSPTRWYSTYDCMRRALTLRMPLERYFREENRTSMRPGDNGGDNAEGGGDAARGGVRAGDSENSGLSEDDFDAFHQVVDALGKIRQMSLLAEQCTEVTMSSVMQFCQRLLYDPKGLQVQRASRGAPVQVVKTLFLREFRKKLLTLLDDVNQVFTWCMAAFVDGRRSQCLPAKMIFENPDEWPNCYKYWKNFKGLKEELSTSLKDQLMDLHARSQQSSSKGELEGEAEQPEVEMSWLTAPDEPRRRRTTTDRFVSIVNQWERYEYNPAELHKGETALQWWMRHESTFPEVAQVARRRLAAQASSATSERSFSKSGLIVQKRRMQLRPDNVDALSLLGWHCHEEHIRSEEAEAEKAAAKLTMKAVTKVASTPVTQAQRQGAHAAAPSAAPSGTQSNVVADAAAHGRERAPPTASVSSSSDSAIHRLRGFARGARQQPKGTGAGKGAGGSSTGGSHRKRVLHKHHRRP